MEFKKKIYTQYGAGFIVVKSHKFRKVSGIKSYCLYLLEIFTVYIRTYTNKERINANFVFRF